MEPVRVKVYGLISLTRKTYLRVQAVGLILALVALGLGLFLKRPEPMPGEKLPEKMIPFVIFLDVLPWLALLLLAAIALETLIVLSRFRQKEAQRQAQQSLQQLSPPPPAPPASPS